MQRHPNKRQPYPLTLDEQRLLFSELDGHMASMALFKVNTGLREPEVVLLIAIGHSRPEADEAHDCGDVRSRAKW